MLRRRNEKAERETVGKRLLQITALRLLGKDRAEICKRLKIGQGSLAECEREDADIGGAVLTDGELADAMVQASLLKLATGGSVRLRKPCKLKSSHYDENGKKVEEEYIEYVSEEVSIPPSLAAQTYWLKNRLRGEWGDEKEALAPKPAGGKMGQGDGGVVILPADEILRLNNLSDLSEEKSETEGSDNE